MVFECDLYIFIIISKQDISFIDDIPAQKDAWLIGDELLKNCYQSLTAMKMQAKLTRKQQPYLTSQFNLSAHWIGYLSSGIHNPVRRISNSLINAMNNNNRMPRLIIYLPEPQLLAHVVYGKFGQSKLIGKVITPMITEIN